MQEETNVRDVAERLALVEKMIEEGRRSVECWGWAFLLWGIAFYVAIVWAGWGQQFSLWNPNYLAWPVTMVAAVALTMVIGLRRGKEKQTTLSRAVVSVWASMGITMMLLFPALSISGRMDQHSFVALVAGILGIANGASGMILKWKLQMACAVVWWVTAVAACFGSHVYLTEVFLAAIFVCQIVFGIYAMIMDARRHAQNGAVIA